MENGDDLESLVAKPWAITEDSQTQKYNSQPDKYQPHKAKEADQCQTKSCQPTSKERDTKFKAIFDNPRHKLIYDEIWNHI